MRVFVFLSLFLIGFSNAYAKENPLLEGFSLLEREEYRQAFKVFSSLRTTSPKRWTGMAIAKYFLGEYEGAKTYFTQALKSEEERRNWVPHYFMALTLYELKEYKEAIPFFNNVIKLRGERADVIFKLGVAYRQMGDLKSALTYLKRAIELKKELPSAYIELASILEEEKMYDDAFAIVEGGLKIMPENRELLYERAKILFQRGQVEAAEKELEKIAKLIDPAKVQKLYSTIAKEKEGKVKSLSPIHPLPKKKIALFLLATMAFLAALVVPGFYIKRKREQEVLSYIDDLLKRGDKVGGRELLDCYSRERDERFSLLWVKLHVLEDDREKALKALNNICNEELRRKLEGLLLIYFSQREDFERLLTLLEIEKKDGLIGFLKAASLSEKGDVLAKIMELSL